MYIESTPLNHPQRWDIHVSSNPNVIITWCLECHGGGGFLVSTLVSINCPLTEINLELFILRYAIKLSMGRCCEFQLGDI